MDIRLTTRTGVVASLLVGVGAACSGAIGQAPAQLPSTAATVRTAASPIVSIAIEDFDGDGRRDIAYTQRNLRFLCVAFGRADGTYTLPATTNLGEYGAHLAAGDFDSDGDLDLAIAKPMAASVSVWSNSGRGSFSQSAEVYVGGYPRSILATDLNQDGTLEMVVTNTELPVTMENVAIIERMGNGNYFAQGIDAGPYVSTAAANDLDLDGRTDLVFGYSALSTQVGLCWNGHDFMGRPLPMGGFSMVEYLPASETGHHPTQVLIANVDGDGDLDIVYTNRTQQIVGVVINDGSANAPGWSGKYDTRIYMSSPATVADLKRTFNWTVNWVEYEPAANGFALFRLALRPLPGNDFEIAPEKQWGLGMIGVFDALASPDLDNDRDPDLAAVAGRYIYASGNPNTNRKPKIEGLRFDKDPVMAGRTLLITAGGVTEPDADGAIREIRFYRDSNRDAALDTNDELIGTDRSGADGWTLSRLVDRAWGAGTLRIFAVAVDELGDTSEPRGNSVVVRANRPPTVGGVTASEQRLRRGQAFSILAPAISDPDADLGDSISRVEVYQDLNRNGTIDAGDRLLKVARRDGASGWRADLRANVAGMGGFGLKTFLVRAIDSEGGTSDPSSVTVRFVRR